MYHENHKKPMPKKKMGKKPGMYKLHKELKAEVKKRSSYK